MSKTLKSYIDWYEEKFMPKRACSFENILNFFSEDISDKEKAHILLVGDKKWPRDTHQWYLKMKMDVYHKMVEEIAEKKLWELPLEPFSTFEDLYKSLEEWMNRPYIRQLTIYDVATRIVIAQGEKRLMPKDYLYLHAKPRGVYNELLKSGLVFYKPQKWNVIIPIGKVPEFGSMEPYYIEDMLCQIGKEFS